MRVTLLLNVKVKIINNFCKYCPALDVRIKSSLEYLRLDGVTAIPLTKSLRTFFSIKTILRASYFFGRR